MVIMNILFVSKYNNVRSKIAEAYFNKLNKLKQLHCQSGGLFRGHPTPTNVMEIAREHRLSLKTSQTALSTYLLEKHDLVILVADDVPTSIFRKDNPYVNAFVWWKVASPNMKDAVSIETTMRDIEKRVQVLLNELGQEKKAMALIDRVLFDLKRWQDPEIVKYWAKLGHPTKKFLGVNPEYLWRLSEKYKGNRQLAMGLWKTGLHDARVLAPMIENPSEVTEHQVETWLRQADYWDITDKIAVCIVAKSDYAVSKLRPWTRENNPFFRRTAWLVIDNWAKDKKNQQLSDKDYERFLELIQKSVNNEDNWVKEAMLHALVQIGGRSGRLHQKALKVASKIGVVEVDYGDPSIPTINFNEKLNRYSFDDD